MGLSEVSTIPWRERNLLELLLFKLEEERLVLSAGLDRWLPQAAREVELVGAELRRLEATRTSAMDDLAAALGLQPGGTLGEVAAAAPPPWDRLLDQHRLAMFEATQAIEPLQRSHDQLLGPRQVEPLLAWLEATQQSDVLSRDPTK